MEETIYGNGINMADVFVRHKHSVQSFRTQSSADSAATARTANSLSMLKYVESTKNEERREKPEIVYLQGWRFHVITFAYVFSVCAPTRGVGPTVGCVSLFFFRLWRLPLSAPRSSLLAMA